MLSIRTDQPLAEIGLFEVNMRNGVLGAKRVTYEKWQAHRQLAEGLHTKITELLHSQAKDFSDLNAVVVFEGPGSFTGLRIGLSVANSLAYALNLPIVASAGKNWIKEGINRINNGENSKVALPVYGSPVHITVAKK